jgi:hypothetical protein
MKKMIFLFALILVAVTSMIAQEVKDTTNVVITLTTGQAILDFLKTNMWALIFIVFSLVSEWLGQTGKIKEGSVFALILNWIGKFIRKQTPIVETKKAKFMSETQLKAVHGAKVIAFLMIFSALSIGAYSQGPWNGFFRPAKMNTKVQTMLKSNASDLVKVTEVTGKESVWLFRPSAALTAIQFTYDKDLKTFISSAFTSAGVGLGYQHYVDNNGTAVNNFGFNLLIMLDGADNTEAGFGVAGTFNALNFVNIGGGYNLTGKKAFLLLGGSWNF